MKTQQIELIVKELKTKEGKAFRAYKAVTVDGKLMDVSFTREVKNLPEKNCIIEVANENMNLDKNRKFPKLWVKKIESIKEFQKQEHDKDLDELFGLPF